MIRTPQSLPGHEAEDISPSFYMAAFPPPLVLENLGGRFLLL